MGIENATPRPWGADSRWPRCLVSQRALPGALSLKVVAQCMTPEDIALTAAAVNSFDAARDALKAALTAAKLDNWDRAGSIRFDAITAIREALALMEGIVP